MARGGRYLAAAAAIVLFAFFAGFLVCAGAIAHYAPPAGLQADGIVVLTGGEHRLSEATRLLAEGRGKRLLISGANRATTRHDLYRKSGLSTSLFERVDVGYAAHDTSGNAEETKAWAAAHGFSRLIIVTSSYHMPRSLAELGRAMPAAALVPYPVVSGNFRTERWWMHGATARLLFFEYVKFLPSAARYCAARLFGWDDSAFANSASRHALSI